MVMIKEKKDLLRKRILSLRNNLIFSFKLWFIDIYYTPQIWFSRIKSFFTNFMLWGYYGAKLNRDFDAAFIFDLLDFKLSRMIKCFEEDKYHGGSKKEVRQMKKLQNRVKRLSKGAGEFEDKYLELLVYSKFGSPKMQFIKDGEHYTCSVVWPNPPKNQIETSKATKKALEKAQKEYRKYFRQTFEMFEKYHQGWWV